MITVPMVMLGFEDRRGTATQGSIGCMYSTDANLMNRHAIRQLTFLNVECFPDRKGKSDDAARRGEHD